MLTPGVIFGHAAVGDLAGVLGSGLWCKGSALCQVKVPVLFERQVGLLGVWELNIIFQELDGDVWGVEVADVADQSVILPILAGVTAVHLNLWRGWRPQMTTISLTSFCQTLTCSIIGPETCYKTY